MSFPNIISSPSSFSTSGSEPGPSTGRLRRQVSRACDSCRARRIKCDDQFPCVPCFRRDTLCTRGELDQEKPKTLQSALNEIDRLRLRVQELQAELHKCQTQMEAMRGRNMSPRQATYDGRCVDGGFDSGQGQMVYPGFQSAHLASSTIFGQGIPEEQVGAAPHEDEPTESDLRSLFSRHYAGSSSAASSRTAGGLDGGYGLATMHSSNVLGHGAASCSAHQSPLPFGDDLGWLDLEPHGSADCETSNRTTYGFPEDPSLGSYDLGGPRDAS